MATLRLASLAFALLAAAATTTARGTLLMLGLLRCFTAWPSLTTLQLGYSTCNMQHKCFTTGEFGITERAIIVAQLNTNSATVLQFLENKAKNSKLLNILICPKCS